MTHLKSKHQHLERFTCFGFIEMIVVSCVFEMRLPNHNLIIVTGSRVYRFHHLSISFNIEASRTIEKKSSRNSFEYSSPDSIAREFGRRSSLWAIMGFYFFLREIICEIIKLRFGTGGVPVCLVG